MLRQQHRFFRSVLIAADTVIISIAVFAAYALRFGVLERWEPSGVSNPTYIVEGLPILATVPLMLIALMWVGLYQPRRDQRYYHEAKTVFTGVALGMLLLLSFLSIFRGTLFNQRTYGATQPVVFAVIASSMLLVWRYVFRLVLRTLRARGWNLRHVGIIGTGRLGQIVCRTLQRNSWTGIKPSFFISHRRRTKRETCCGLPVVGGLNDLDRILEEYNLSGVFIAVPGVRIATVPELLKRLERFPLDVRVVPDMNPKYMPINMAVHDLDGMPILSVRESPLSGWGHVLKRGLDIAGSLFALVIFAMPMVAIWVTIRLTSEGPAVFRQERISLNGQRFKIFKFRTMSHVSAEQAALRDAETGVEAWTKRNDERITPFGRFLRNFSLDELPQLFNVLIGEMALVGPRPERPELIDSFRDDWRGYMLRQNVKAGITGWAQVNGLRGDTSLRKRLQYD
ncbi:MAG: exopolysaccharide biosynthesis polyprenyl glycosylphosphotransferase, partial [Phycisphaerales bacterium]|nr:exopolysaccharide biosynthesis polyprenyl glycosylphosphotransferase [Phycisphaerales bacterium]